MYLPDHLAHERELLDIEAAGARHPLGLRAAPLYICRSHFARRRSRGDSTKTRHFLTALALAIALAAATSVSAEGPDVIEFGANGVS